MVPVYSGQPWMIFDVLEARASGFTTKALTDIAFEELQTTSCDYSQHRKRLSLTP